MSEGPNILVAHALKEKSIGHHFFSLFFFLTLTCNLSVGTCTFVRLHEAFVRGLT